MLEAILVKSLVERIKNNDNFYRYKSLKKCFEKFMFLVYLVVL